MTSRISLFSTIGAFLGIAVSFWNVNSGFAVGLIGVFVGTLVAQYRIGLRRFAALVLVSALGNIFPPLVDAAIDGTNDEAVNPDEDRLADWVKAAWAREPPRFGVSFGILTLSVLISAIVIFLDYRTVTAGGQGWVLPVTRWTSPLDLQASYCTLISTSLIANAAFSIYSMALRRALFLAGVVGSCFGVIVGISVGDWSGIAPFLFALIFTAATIKFALMVMWAERGEHQQPIE